jgi:hypothetical protein
VGNRFNKDESKGVNIPMDQEIKEIMRRSGLFEMTLPEMDAYREQAIKYAIEMNQDNLWDEYLHESGEEDIDRNDPATLNDFNEFARYHMADKIEDAEWRIRQGSQANGTSMIIYRMIEVPENWIKSGGLTAQPLGIYWTYDKSCADTYWGGRHQGIVIKYIVEAQTALSSINWVETLGLNAHITMGDMEKEIRLIKGSKIKLRAIYDDGKNAKPLPLGKFQGMILPV